MKNARTKLRPGKRTRVRKIAAIVPKSVDTTITENPRRRLNRYAGRKTSEVRNDCTQRSDNPSGGKVR